MKGICSLAIIGMIAAVNPAAAQEQEAPAAPQAEAAAPAEAEAAGEGEARSEAAAAPEEEEMVCRTERITGSLTRRKRTCMTAAQWAELERRTYQGLNDFTRSAAGGACIPDDPMSGGRC